MYAQHGCQRGASTRNMSWGGMKTWIPCPGNPRALKTNYLFCFNILLVTILRYNILCWRSTGRINRHFTMVYHPWRPPLKLTLIYYSGNCFCTCWLLHYADGQQMFLGSSTHNISQRPGARAASATQQSHKDLGFFHGADTTVVLRARNTGMHQV